jgi:regulator of PEP synthase PpsR (kinase-PPPase family)
MDATPHGEGSAELHVFIISDATGRTAERVIDAALYQFEATHVVLHRFPRVLSRPLIDRILDQARSLDAVMVCTIVEAALAEYLRERAHELGVAMVDVMWPIINMIGNVVRRHPLGLPRPRHHYDEQFFSRSDAINFTVRHDDGRRLEEIDQADVVLVGVSRAGKTPTSIYLATRGWWVANIPLAHGLPLPEALGRVDPRRVVVLTRNSAALARLRESRTTISAKQAQSYADLQAIRMEQQYVRQLLRRHERHWPVIDVTSMSIEETAIAIEQILAAIGRRHHDVGAAAATTGDL